MDDSDDPLIDDFSKLLSRDKPLSLLNKKKLSKREMDEIFTGE